MVDEKTYENWLALYLSIVADYSVDKSLIAMGFTQERDEDKEMDYE